MRRGSAHRRHEQELMPAIDDSTAIAQQVDSDCAIDGLDANVMAEVLSLRIPLQFRNREELRLTHARGLIGDDCRRVGEDASAEA